MMMWHHLFLKGRFETYSIIFTPLTAEQVTRIASYCKLCVSLFAFISGYGLWKSYTSTKYSPQKWCLQRYLKTFSGYWFIVILSWLICQPINQRPYKVYGFEKSIFYGIWNMTAEILGISHLVQEYSEQSMLGTWWYMGAALAFIMISPMLFELMGRFGDIPTYAAVVLLPRVFFNFPGTGNFYSFLPVFLSGAIFAKNDLFEKISNWNLLPVTNQTAFSSIVKLMFLVFGCRVTYKWYCHIQISIWWDVAYGLFAIPPIMLSVELFHLFPLLREVLGFIGKHSANIFLTHNFIRVVFFTKFIYSRGHFVTIILCLLFISIGISVIVDFLKKITKYDSIVQKFNFWLVSSDL